MLVFLVKVAYLSIIKLKQTKIMSTFNLTAYLEGSTERANKYVSKLKHGTSFKYVKGFSKEEKTLLSTMLTRQNNGEFLKLKNDEMEAFGLTPTNKNGMVMAIDVDIHGRLSIVPVSEF